MKNFIEKNWFKLAILSVVSIAMLGHFFWYGYRPYKAKKDCAWVKVHKDAVVYRPAIGSEEAKKDCVEKCPLVKSYFVDFIKNQSCVTKCDSLYSPEQKAEPETNWWRQASEEKYKDCLRGRGF